MAQLIEHSERSHALLSASGAGRWLNCTPAPRLEEKYGENRTSTYAQEGTIAHELAELYLRKDCLNTLSAEDFSKEVEKLMADDLFNEEMLEMVPIYTEYCAAELAEAKVNSGEALMEIEQKLDLTAYIPNSFGTADCIIISDNTIEVIDLKYGKGVPVYAEWNKQLMIYGLGALWKYDTLYYVENIKLTIIQPRLNNISTWQISVKDLISWANSELLPKAKLAYEGKGELNTGEWCRFCGVRNRCRKLYEAQIEIAKYDFAEPDMLTDSEIADVVLRTPRLIEWANSVKDYAEQQAIQSDKHWPGLKLVAGRSIRKWSQNDDEIASIIATRCPELSEDEIYDLKLKSLTGIEKVVGKKKFAEVFSDVVIKPDGKPMLVSEDNKRPALGLDDAKNDFKNE